MLGELNEPEKFPEPGTLDDLIVDASALGLRFDERLARSWHSRGLLASPQRRPLGRGQGSGPGLYSRERRYLFRAVAHHRAGGSKYEMLARIPIWSWMNQGDDWVDLEQLRRALRTVVGAHAGASKRSAQRIAQQLLNILDFHHGSLKDRGILRDELIDQLRRGIINAEALQPKIAAVFQPPGIHVLRGPARAPLGVHQATQLLALTMLASAKLKSVTDDQLLTARLQHQITTAEYRRDRASLPGDAGSLKHLFIEETLDQQIAGSVTSLLFLIGIQLSPTCQPQPR